jgi:hypothetical protein
MKTNSKVLFLFGLSTVGMIIFAGLYIFNPRTIPDTKVITNTDTSIVTNTVKQEVVTEVPAQLSEETLSQIGIGKQVQYGIANHAALDEVLFLRKDIRVEIIIEPKINDTIIEDQVRAKFELVLRRNNVPLNPNSTNTVTFAINGFWGQNNDGAKNDLLIYKVGCYVNDWQPVFQDGVCHYAFVRIWSKGNSFGTVGKLKATESILDDAEKEAEIFANDYLTANPPSK